MNATDIVYFYDSKKILDKLGIKYSVNISPIRAVKFNYFIALRETDFNILLNYVKNLDDETWIDFLLNKKYIIPFPDSKCCSKLEPNTPERRKLNRKERRSLKKRGNK